MGKTPKPLVIYTTPEIAAWEEVQALAAQGHTIMTRNLQPGENGPTFYDLDYFDVILHPRAWLMDDAHRKFLDLAIDNARKRRYPSKKGG